MNIQTLIDEYVNNGYNYDDASAKVCQDILLIKISNSKFKRNITIKGGVVMHSISDDVRRATRDLDLDFIKYSLDNESIKQFISILNNSDNDITIEIIGNIKQLHQHDYNGKRVYLKISDLFKNELTTKLDIGVEKNFYIDQDEYCFNLGVTHKKVNLLINSKEQIFAEKLKSLLKLGLRSTRYKDLFDFYYLITETKLNNDKMYQYINKLIFKDKTMRENNMIDIIKRLDMTLNSLRFKNNLNNPKVNWLDVSIEVAIDNVLNYLNSLEVVSAIEV